MFGGSESTRTSRLTFVTLHLKLAGHLECHPTPGAVPTQQVWAAWLHLLHLPDVVRGHILHPVVDRLVRRQGPGVV